MLLLTSPCPRNCSVHNVTADYILQHQDEYFCNWPYKSLPGQPDFRQVKEPHGGVYLSDIRRHSDAASVKQLLDKKWDSEWHAAWQNLRDQPDQWLDYRAWKETYGRATFPDFKPTDPASKFPALWKSPTFEHLLPAKGAVSEAQL